MKAGAVGGMLELPRYPYKEPYRYKGTVRSAGDGLESILEPWKPSLIENKPKLNATLETGCFDG